MAGASRSVILSPILAYSTGWMLMKRPRCAVIFELHAAVDLGEERVVLAETDVEPGLEPAAALAHEDRAAGHDVAVVALDAEPLRVAVAPVAGAALSFF